MNINLNADLIYKNNGGYEVYMAQIVELSTLRLSYNFLIKMPTGEISDIVTVTRKDIFTKKSPFDFILDIMGGFDRDDIKSIEEKSFEKINQQRNDCSNRIKIQERATMEEIPHIMTRYIRNNKEEVEDNNCANIFVRGEYGFIRTAYMEDVMKSLKEGLEYKKKELLKRLKIMGLLKTGKDRAYDVVVRINGLLGHYYQIKLIEANTDREEVDEEIQAEQEGE